MTLYIQIVCSQQTKRQMRELFACIDVNAASYFTLPSHALHSVAAVVRNHTRTHASLKEMEGLCTGAGAPAVENIAVDGCGVGHLHRLLCGRHLCRDVEHAPGAAPLLPFS